MGSLKLPILKSGVTVDPTTVVGKLGELAFDADGKVLRSLDGTTPGGIVLQGDVISLAPGDGVTDDTPTLQAELDAIKASGRRGALRLRPGGNYQLKSRLVIDASYCTLDGSGADLHASGDGILVTGSKAIPFDQGGNSIRNLQLIGPGGYPASGPGATNAGTSVGILFQGVAGTPAGPQHIKLNNVQVKLFDTAYLYGYNAILIDHFGCEAGNCNTGIKSIGGDGDTNEGVKLVGGTVYNCGIGVQQSDKANNGSITLIGTHINYCRKPFLNTSGGIIAGDDLWIEGYDYSEIPIEINGPNTANAVIRLHIMKWVTNPRPAATSDPIFSHVAAGGPNTAIRLTFDFITRIPSASGEWYTGDGKFEVRILQTPGVVESPPVVRADRSLLADGSFVSNSFMDDWSLTAYDTASQTLASRYAANQTAGGADGTRITINDAYARSTPYSLSLLKVGGAGKPAAFTLTIPAEEGGRYTGRLFLVKPGASLGTVYVNFLWTTSLGRDQFGRHGIVRQEVINSVPIVFTAANTGFVQFVTPPAPFWRPDWARFFTVQIDATQWAANGEQLFVDDVNIGRGG